MTCSFPDCGKPLKSALYCQGHLSQLKRGSPLTPLRTWSRKTGECSVEDCVRPDLTGGMCATHYQRLLRGNETLGVRPRTQSGMRCTGPECDRQATSTGLCRTHSWQAGQGKTLTVVRPRNPTECPVAGCARISTFGVLCSRHSRYALIFNMTIEDFVALLARGKCDICGKSGEYRKGDLAIDHDHSCCPEPARSCGKCIRGLLCSQCNWAIGQAGDSPERLRAMADYLETPAK